MELGPYLNFNGQCESAFEFYVQILGGKIEGMWTFGGSPMGKDVPPDWQNKIMHGHINVDGKILMGADAPPGHYQQPQGFSVSLRVKELAEAERIFQALSEKGKVQMPLQKTFWSAGFGMLVDQFGVPWMINCLQAA